jgi:TonB family protein
MFARLAKLFCLLATLLGLAVPAAHAADAAKQPLPQLTVKLESVTYPEAVRKAGIQGRVLVAFTITKRGHVDEPEVVSAEPPTDFDVAALKAVKQVKFTVPKDWDDTGATSYRYQLSVLFKLNPCVAPACLAPKPHESADDFLVIGAEAPR